MSVNTLVSRYSYSFLHVKVSYVIAKQGTLIHIVHPSQYDSDIQWIYYVNGKIKCNLNVKVLCSNPSRIRNPILLPNDFWISEVQEHFKNPTIIFCTTCLKISKDHD